MEPPVNKIIQGDCLEVLKTLPENSVDSIVTDPPYGLEFMGKDWDAPWKYRKMSPLSFMPNTNPLPSFNSNRNPMCKNCHKPKRGAKKCNCENPNFDTQDKKNEDMYKLQGWNFQWATECLRVLKPGGHLLSFGGDRTHHRMMVAIEDSGFEIRTTLCWAFGSGFPKSLNVTKKIRQILPSDVQCVCVPSLKQTDEGLISGYQEYSRFYDGQLLGELNNDPNVSPLQDDAHEHSRAYQQKDVQEIKQDDKFYSSKSLNKNHPSNEDSSHERQRLSKDSQVSDSVQSDNPLSKLNGELKVGHKKGSDKSNKLHLDDDLASSYSKVYTNLSQCQICGKYKIPEGLGTALKPAVEYICMARKPLGEKTVAENVLKYGTGGINIDESRVGTEEISVHNAPKGTFAGGEPNRGSDTESYRNHQGRFPANLIHDGSEEVGGCFPQSKSAPFKSATTKGRRENTYNQSEFDYSGRGFTDSGNASRFFKSIIYTAKASKSERNEGLEDFEERKSELNSGGIGRKISVEKRLESDEINAPKMKNFHPTVKPVALMSYLIKMITPKGGIVLDPFAGSGSTLVAAKKLGYSYIGIEKEAEYVKIAETRIGSVLEKLL